MCVTYIVVVYYWVSVECKLYCAHAYHLVGASGKPHLTSLSTLHSPTLCTLILDYFQCKCILPYKSYTFIHHLQPNFT